MRFLRFRLAARCLGVLSVVLTVGGRPAVAQTVATGPTAGESADRGRLGIVAKPLREPVRDTAGGDQQTGSVVGVVRADGGGAPIADVTVSISGSRLAALTNGDGRYLIVNVPVGSHRLVARRLGFRAADTTVVIDDGKETIADFRLRPTPVDLDAVVTIGYGQQTKVNLTGSVATVRGDELARRPVVRAADALQGTAPGLTVIDRGGRPGHSGSSLNIRGRGTINSSTSPLVLIDGVTGDINSLNTDDIESISVLKDGASSAIYGARAANGVILVSTKRGSNTGGILTSYNAFYGVQSASNLPERIGVKDYLELINEAHVNANLAPKYSPGYIDSTVRHLDPLRYPDTDWLGVLWKSAPVQDHSLRFGGGNELARFALSTNYMEQQGMLPNAGANRYGLRFNSDFQPTPRIQTGIDLALRRTWDTESSAMGDALFRMFHDVPPTIVPRYPDGTYGWSQNGHNPLAYAEAAGRHDQQYLHGTVTPKADFTLLPGLTLRTLAAVQAGSWKDETWRNETVFRDYFNPTVVRKVFSPNSLSQTRSSDLETYLRALLEYSTVFGDNSLTTMVGYEQTANDWEETGASRAAFYNNDLQQINAGDRAQDNTWGTARAWRLRSGFGRLNHVWRGKYLFEANARYDGSSRFARARRFGLFPSFSAGWRISEEPFMRHLGFINDLKLRGSWGKTGNHNVGEYAYYSLINLGASYPLGGALVPGAARNVLGNDGITWETTTIADMGIDAQLFQGRLSFTGDVYRKNTSGILITLPIPAAIGLSPPTQNAAKVRNTGWEAALTFRDAVRDVHYSLGLNFWDNVNQVVDLAGTGPYIDGRWLTKEGNSLGTIYGYQTSGFFQSLAEVQAAAKQHPSTGPGDLRFVDQNGDGKIDNADKVPIGNELPRYTFGSTWTASYKGFDASVFWQGVLKVDAYIEGALAEGPVWENYTTKEWLNHWTPTNPNATMPKPTLRLHINHGPVSSFWVRDASYIKLKNGQIGYTLPQSFAQRRGVRQMRLFVSGQNLLTFSKLAFLLDPEVPSGRGTVYPQTRTISVGTSLQF
ncbi:MAG: TonB-dependent receptor [Gemmatimonadaceae bacterium]